MTDWLFHPLSFSPFLIGMCRFVMALVILHAGVMHFRGRQYIRGTAAALYAAFLYLSTADVPSNPNAQVLTVSSLGLYALLTAYFLSVGVVAYQRRKRNHRRLYG